MDDQNHILSFQDFLSAHADIETAFKDICHSRTYAKGSIIVSQGETDKDMFLLRKGRAKVVIYSEGGNEIHLAELKPGTLFGEMAILLNAARSSNVAAQVSCSLESVSAHDFNNLMKTFPELALFMTQMLASRLQQTSQSLFENLAFTVPQRTYEYLLRQAVQSPADEEVFHIAPPPSVTALSESLNVSREATSRAITKLISQGLVKKEKALWKILRPNFKAS
ncbi:MAG: Crp/Fnr family transcriptional regulator [Hellea sp.]